MAWWWLAVYPPLTLAHAIRAPLPNTNCTSATPAAPSRPAASPRSDQQSTSVTTAPGPAPGPAPGLCGVRPGTKCPSPPSYTSTVRWWSAPLSSGRRRRGRTQQAAAARRVPHHLPPPHPGHPLRPQHAQQRQPQRAHRPTTHQHPPTLPPPHVARACRAPGGLRPCQAAALSHRTWRPRRAAPLPRQWRPGPDMDQDCACGTLRQRSREEKCPSNSGASPGQTGLACLTQSRWRAAAP